VPEMIPRDRIHPNDWNANAFDPGNYPHCSQCQQIAKNQHAPESQMKINLIGMILNNAGRRCFDGALIDDNGKPMSAADSLHHMILEYAKVVNDGTSDVVTISREVTSAHP